MFILGSFKVVGGDEGVLGVRPFNTLLLRLPHILTLLLLLVLHLLLLLRWKVELLILLHLLMLLVLDLLQVLLLPCQWRQRRWILAPPLLPLLHIASSLLHLVHLFVGHLLGTWSTLIKNVHASALVVVAVLRTIRHQFIRIIFLHSLACTTGRHDVVAIDVALKVCFFGFFSDLHVVLLPLYKHLSLHILVLLGSSLIII